MPDSNTFSNTSSALLFWVCFTTICCSLSWKPPLCWEIRRRIKSKTASSKHISSLQAHFAYCTSFQVKYIWSKILVLCALMTFFEKATKDGGRETSMCCYLAIFTWLWAYKLRASGAVSQYLEQHLAYGRLDVCWMTKWLNEGLPAPKSCLSFPSNGTASWLFSLYFPALVQCDLLSC